MISNAFIFIREKTRKSIIDRPTENMVYRVDVLGQPKIIVNRKKIIHFQYKNDFYSITDR